MRFQNKQSLKQTVVNNWDKTTRAFHISSNRPEMLHAKTYLREKNHKNNNNKNFFENICGKTQDL